MAFFEEGCRGRDRIGFPLAELQAGPARRVITKAPGKTGGHGLTVGTVTAQLLYEDRRSRATSGPDAGGPGSTPSSSRRRVPDRVRHRRGPGAEPPPGHAEGYGQPRCRLAQLHDAGVDPAPRWPRRPGFAAARGVGPGIPRRARAAFAESAEDLSGDTDRAAAWRTCALRRARRTTSRRSAGPSRAPFVETSLSSYPGTFFTSAPSGGARGGPLLADHGRPPAPVTPRLRVRRPNRSRSRPMAWCRRRPSTDAASLSSEASAPPDRSAGAGVDHGAGPAVGAGRRPRSGDKGGDATSGVWADDDAVGGLASSWTSPRRPFRALLPELGPFAVSRYALPNLRAVNFVVHGVLRLGVASNLRLDTQAQRASASSCARRLTEVPAAFGGDRTGGGEGWPRADDRPGRTRPGASGRMAPWSRSPRLIRASWRAIALVLATAWSVFYGARSCPG